MDAARDLKASQPAVLQIERSASCSSWHSGQWSWRVTVD